MAPRSGIEALGSKVEFGGVFGGFVGFLCGLRFRGFGGFWGVWGLGFWVKGSGVWGVWGGFGLRVKSLGFTWESLTLENKRVCLKNPCTCWLITQTPSLDAKPRV